MNFFSELKRRNVLRVATAYIVVAWLVIQVVETIFPAFGFGDPAVRLVVIIFGIGFIPALIAAWVFEFTPQGLKRDSEVSRADSVTPTNAKKLDRIIILVLTLALVWFAFDEFVIESQPEAAIETSIAVLPFSNRSADANDAFFVDGIHDDILTQLANLSGLNKVISRTSVVQYRDTTKSMLNIGKELGVANILEGGVQRAGNRIRINMQLIDTASDKHLWAETYDREMTVENLFAIQSEISREVVLALQGVLTEQDDTKLARLPTSSLEAYGEFVLGRQEMAKRTVEDMNKAIMHFEKAILLDPDYALPYVGLSDSIAIRAFLDRQDTSKFFERRQELIEKALSQYPLSGEAWASKGLLESDQDKLEEAARSFEKAIELSPGYPSAYQWYSHILHEDPEKRMRFLQKAIELDPLAGVLKINLADNLRELERFDEMIELLKKGNAQDPGFELYYEALSEAYLHTGQIAEMLRWSQEGVRRGPKDLAPRIYVCWALLNLVADQLTEQCVLEFAEDFPELGYMMLGDPHRQSGDFDEALAVTLKYPAEPTELPQQEMLAWSYLEAGNFYKATEIARIISAEYFGHEPVSVPPRGLSQALQAVYLLQEVGRNDRANEVAEAILETMNNLPRIGRYGYGFWDVFVHVARGDRARALIALREAVDSGLRSDWWRLKMPHTVSMHEDAEWNAMIGELEADMARQWEWYLAHKDDPLQ